MTLTVVLYGRDGCCLCDDAREVLRRIREKLARQDDRSVLV